MALCWRSRCFDWRVKSYMYHVSHAMPTRLVLRHSMCPDKTKQTIRYQKLFVHDHSFFCCGVAVEIKYWFCHVFRWFQLSCMPVLSVSYWGRTVRCVSTLHSKIASSPSVLVLMFIRVLRFDVWLSGYHSVAILQINFRRGVKNTENVPARKSAQPAPRPVRIGLIYAS